MITTEKGNLYFGPKTGANKVNIHECGSLKITHWEECIPNFAQFIPNSNKIYYDKNFTVKLNSRYFFLECFLFTFLSLCLYFLCIFKLNHSFKEARQNRLGELMHCFENKVFEVELPAAKWNSTMKSFSQSFADTPPVSFHSYSKRGPYFC